MSGGAEVWFYHLEGQPAETVLPSLLEKTLARGWRAVVETVSPERAAELDAVLWSYDAGSFLPHGLASDPRPERQPIVIAAGPEAPNGAAVRFLLDGAPPGDLTGLTRVIVLFDGQSEAALALARDAWRQLKAAGHTLAYWQQGEAGWEKKQ